MSGAQRCLASRLFEWFILSHDTSKRRTRAKILDQVLDVAEISAEQLLLVRRRQRAASLAVGATALLGRVAAAAAKGACELAGTALEHIRQRVAAAGEAGDGGRLGHEVKVEKLDELELDLARGGARLEERGDGEQAVEALKDARVPGRLDEGDDEGEEGGGLDGGAVEGFEEVEEELWVETFVSNQCVLLFRLYVGASLRNLFLVLFLCLHSCFARAGKDLCWEDAAASRPAAGPAR